MCPDYQISCGRRPQQEPADFGQSESPIICEQPDVFGNYRGIIVPLLRFCHPGTQCFGDSRVELSGGLRVAEGTVRVDSSDGEPGRNSGSSRRGPHQDGCLGGDAILLRLNSTLEMSNVRWRSSSTGSGCLLICCKHCELQHHYFFINDI